MVRKIRLKPAVMLQEHHSGEGFSDLGGPGIHLLVCAFGWGRGMPSFGASSQPWVC